MSAEQRWADRREWEQERGEIEIKSKRRINDRDHDCALQFRRNCVNPARTRYEIGPVRTGAAWTSVDLCSDHDDEDTAYAVYEG
jgi:hypothetical protein